MHVITQNCCNDASCVPACPVNCIHPTPDEPEFLTAEMLYIDPDVCIDCGACIDVCPVNAIAMVDELAASQQSFVELNAHWYREETHRDYPTTPVVPPARRFTGVTAGPLRVAVIGSGPAGCYAIEELVSQRGLDVEVSVFERLPAVGGLVRYGVAPDHQDTKAVGDELVRTLRRSGVSVFLNVEVGTDITHAELMAYHHAAIYAVGAPDDRRLAIPGEELGGSNTATEFVAWYNGHPDFADRVFDLSHERAVIIGNGNVALDVARILISDPDALRRTDIAAHALDQLAESAIREVVVAGRRGPAQASFTIAELLGLTTVRGVDVVARDRELVLDPATLAAYTGHEYAMDLYKVDLLRRLPAATGAARRIELRFLVSPTEILGSGRVSGVRLARNELQLEGRTPVAHSTNDVEVIDCGLLLRSVGYRGRPLAGVPFDPSRGVIPNHAGRVIDAAASTPDSHAGIYTVGWIKRGPSGGIGANRHCARSTVAAVIYDYISGRLATPTKDPKSLRHTLLNKVVIGMAEWNAIDGHERRLGRELSRPRVKLTDREQMIQIARAADGESR